MKKKPSNRFISWSVMIFGVSLIVVFASGSSLLAYVPRHFQAPVESTVQTNPPVDAPSLQVPGAHSGEPAQVAVLETPSETSKQTGAEQEDVVTQVYALSHALASELAQVLEGMFTAESVKPKIKTDTQTNSLVVTCTKENNRRIDEIIQLLDKPPIQIMVESMIVEFASSELEKLGPLRDDSFYSQLKPAELEKKIQSGGIKAKILSNPKLLTLEQKECKIALGKRVQVHYMEKTGDGLYKPKVLETPIGVQFSVTPDIVDELTDTRAINEELIQMDISIQVTDISGRLTISEIPDLDIGKPTIRIREHTENVVLKNGETMVIGGINKENAEEGSEVIAFITANIVKK